MPRKLTQQEVDVKVQEICNTKGYGLAKPFVYIGAHKTRLHLKCLHGHEWNTSYHSLVNTRTGCKKCFDKSSGEKKRTSQQEADARVQEMCSTKGYVLTQPFVYIGAAETRLHLKCLHDGHKWDVSYASLVNTGSDCPKCKGSIKFTQQEADARVLEKCKEKNCILNNPFVYKNCETRLSLTCSSGHGWDVSFNGFVNSGSNCHRCADKANGKKRRFTQQEADARVLEKCKEKNCILNNPFVYTGSKKTLLHLKCLHDGHEWDVSYARFVNSDSGCPKCADKSSGRNCSTTQQEADARVLEKCKEKNCILNNPFVYIGVHKTRLHLKCLHGHEWDISYERFVNSGSGCSKCAGHNHKYNYISGLYDDLGNCIALKYGIESTEGSRSKNQNRKSTYTVQRLATYLALDNYSCKQAESVCISLFQAENIEKIGRIGYVSWREMNDGWTETTSVLNFDRIVQIYEEHGAVLLTPEELAAEEIAEQDEPEEVPEIQEVSEVPVELVQPYTLQQRTRVFRI